MHEMWCGPDASGKPTWHVLTADKADTLCGVGKRAEPRGQEQTDDHFFACMATLQAAMKPVGAAEHDES